METTDQKFEHTTNRGLFISKRIHQLMNRVEGYTPPLKQLLELEDKLLELIAEAKDKLEVAAGVCSVMSNQTFQTAYGVVTLKPRYFNWLVNEFAIELNSIFFYFTFNYNFLILNKKAPLQEGGNSTIAIITPVIATPAI